MALATATPNGAPSARIVLLKGFSSEGFVFFTNYGGRKGEEIAANPRVAALFYWDVLQRQVRVEGGIAKIPEEESDEYFQSRSTDAQIGAWASRQSQQIPDRSFLEQRILELQNQFGTQPIPRPPFWGGYRISPQSFEFWQGRSNRLHDRLLYIQQPDGSWNLTRLSP